jgi:hypothetical protein
VRQYHSKKWILLDLVDTREAKEVSANNQPSGFEACVLNGME